ncbi:MAG: Flp pilus assembly complex ATPase component TadA [Kiritimatiellaeota bacterium]|nr:Flp pilus assembly complex ATPase component TadA [Kiritimatiellota bacterium]
MTSNDDYVLQVLLEHHKVTQDQAAKAASRAAAGDESVVDRLIKENQIHEGDVLSLMANVFGMEYVDISKVEVTDELRNQVAGDLAKKYGIVPLFRSGNMLTVAIGDPTNMDVLDSLRYALGCDIEAVVASRTQIQTLMGMLYPEQSASDMENLLSEIGTGDGTISGTGDAALDQQLAAGAGEGDAPIINLCGSIIMKAFANRASDIHLEPMEKRFRIRYRIDGVLRDQDAPPKRLQGAILQRFKLMAGMKLSEKRVPQDGRIQIAIKGRELDLRVSTVPTDHGESIVMRILDKQNLALGLPELGLLSDDQQVFEDLIKLPDGIILVTGPTGSGKTTTLYASLGQINLPDRKIITVEEPVEYQLTGINQVQVNSDVGMTFANALRSILRQAPNIVMIGEIRDLETASIAIEAALTGHLVFSTLHTNDAPSAITRLLDIGIKPFLVASALRAAMAQRLVRAICTECREPYTPTERELRMLGTSATEVSGIELYHGAGCQRCGDRGYKGRKGIFEIFRLNEAIERMIFNREGVRELRQAARENGMRTLREDGIRKVLSGMTTIEEVLRITMGDEN